MLIPIYADLLLWQESSIYKSQSALLFMTVLSFRPEKFLQRSEKNGPVIQNAEIFAAKRKNFAAEESRRRWLPKDQFLSSKNVQSPSPDQYDLLDFSAPIRYAHLQSK